MARDNLTFDDLLSIARRVGVEVVAAPSSHRGSKGRMGTVTGVTVHHTGTDEDFKPDQDYPTYQVVKEGRPGLENSLSAFGLGRWRAIYVFSEFLSWHAGEWLWLGITDGNGHFLGIECAGVGDYTEFQRRVYPRLVAAILLDIGAGRDWAPLHLEGAMPRGRKTDAANTGGDFYQGHDFRWWVDFFMANPQYININYIDPEEDDMPQVISVQVQPGEEKVINIAPSGGMVDGKFVPGGSARFGQAWVSFLTDCFETPREKVPARIGIMNSQGVWRPAFGTSYDTTLEASKRRVVTLAAGDAALVVSAKGEFPIGVAVEYAKA